MTMPTNDYADTLRVTFLEEDRQEPIAVAADLAALLRSARHSIDIAIYDCRLSAGPATMLRNALEAALRAGVMVRLVYDAGEKPQSSADIDERGTEPTPMETHERIEELGLPSSCLRAISGYRALMHHKYIIVDSAQVWTGSLNFSDDSMRRMENMVVVCQSSRLAGYVRRDFEHLWETGRIEASGAFATSPETLIYAGRPAPTDIDFSPGQGEAINALIANRVAAAKSRVVICSMLFTSSRLLRALSDHVSRGVIEISGVYDGTQMSGVLDQWKGRGDLAWKIAAVEDTIRYGALVGKRSTPYRSGASHNFLHVKTIVVDDTVLTGSHNFSHAAVANAENVLTISSVALADETAAYARRLANRYRRQQMV